MLWLADSVLFYAKLQFFTPFLYNIYDYTITIEIIAFDKLITLYVLWQFRRSMLKYRAISHLDSQRGEEGKIAPGGGGPWVYLVEERKSNRRFVMRKMEVEDSGVADKARTQFDDVITIREPRVARYVECFASWSKLDAALYLCLVGEYFPGGSVRQLLRGRAEKGVQVGEGEVKRWYAQMLEGLEGLHREGRVHRRVKSSNVFVRDGSLVLGCMGLQAEEGKLSYTTPSTLVHNLGSIDPLAVHRRYQGVHSFRNFVLWLINRGKGSIEYMKFALGVHSQKGLKTADLVYTIDII